MKNHMGFFDGPGDGLDFDQSHDHDQQHNEVAVDQNQPAPQPKKTTLKQAGSKSSKRITGPSNASDPMHDKVVLNELGQPLPFEEDIDFPYEATVITKQNPLRIRESHSLTAKVVKGGHMPRGHAVQVTGPSVNHFRPVLYKDGDKPPIKGWSFTAYLSPPTHMQTYTLPEVVVTATRKKKAVEQPVANEDVPLTHEEAHLDVVLPAEIKVDGPSIAGKVADDMKKLNGPTVALGTGLHYKDRYQQELEQAGRGSEWRPYWEMGHTASEAWSQPYQDNQFMTWTLKHGRSASEALRQWLAGLTIADCASAMVAIELDAVRAAVGDKIFDRCFGSTTGRGAMQQLTISQRVSETPLHTLMRYTDAATGATKGGGAMGKRPVKAGEWYYFRNVPDYVLKHPGGAWRGENALFLGEQNGKQMWSGLGVTSDEEGLMRVLVDEYNKPRDQRDFDFLKRHFNGPSFWSPEYREGFSANAPDERPIRNDGKKDLLKLEDVLAAQALPQAPGDKRRPSGFAAESGVALSPAKLIELVMKYGDPSPDDYQVPPGKRDDDGTRLA